MKNLNRQTGFTLVEMAIVLVIAGLLMGGAIKLMQPLLTNTEQSTTETKEKNIAQTLALFAQNYGRLPCPATSTPGIETFGYPHNSGAGGANFDTADCGGQFIGILPFKVLGISEEQAKDSYGNFFTYAVNPPMTEYNRLAPNNTTALQNACSGPVWIDTAGNLKNEKKAHVCCPEPDPGFAALSVLDSNVGGKSLFNPGPIKSTGWITQPTIKRTVSLKVYQRYTTVDWRESQGCDHNTTLGRTHSHSTKHCYFTENSPYTADPEFAANWNANAVMTGRIHEVTDSSGDENDKTRNQYGMLKAYYDDDGTEAIGPVTVQNAQDEVIIPRESHQSFPDGSSTLGWMGVWPAPDVFPDAYPNRSGSVLIGRQHQGDENDPTNYRTGFLFFDGNPSTLTDVRSDVIGSESSGVGFYTDDNHVLIERIHQQICNYTGFFNVFSSVECGGTGTPTLYRSAQVKSYKMVVPPPGPRDNMMAYVLISHGKNGNGSYQKNTLQKPRPFGSQESGNYDNDLNFVSADYSTADGPNYFDDIVLWRTNDQLVSEFSHDNCTRP